MERRNRRIGEWKWSGWLLLLGIMVSCASGKLTSPDKYAGERLTVGSGGGITGAQTEYVLLDNGQVFKRTINGAKIQLSKVKTLPKDMAAEDFNRAKQLQVNMIKVNMPGNMYSYLEYKTAAGTNRLVWNERQDGVPPPIVGFYDFLMKTLSEDKH